VLIRSFPQVRSIRLDRLHILLVLYKPAASYPLELYVPIGEFDGLFIPRRKGLWGYQHLFFFQFFHRFWTAKEGMDGFCLFLEFSQIGSGIRQVSCPPPTTRDCRGFVDLCPANVAYGADQAGRIIIATYRLVVFGAEAPHVATLAKVLWAGGVEIMAHLVIQGLEG